MERFSQMKPRKKISIANKGKTRSSEIRKKMSIARKGEKNHLAKLNDHQVLEIRQLLASKSHTQKEIATMYGVSIPVISSIKAGRIWNHL